jgi:hypothetical protein
MAVEITAGGYRLIGRGSKLAGQHWLCRGEAARRA